jgi:hypothetical protein
MDKRLVKRHKRQVARAKEHVKLSEPDVRTPEQIKAAREASRPPIGGAKGLNLHDSAPTSRTAPARSSGTRTDVSD